MKREWDPIRYEVDAYIFVGSFYCMSPKEITAHLGVEPFSTSDTPMKRGAKRPPGWQTWFYHSEKSSKQRIDSIDECVRELLDSVLPRKEPFATLPDDCEKELVVTVFTDDQRPNVELSPHTMKLLAEFGMRLRVAIYCDPDEIED